MESRKLRILIAEDEARIGQLIRKLIHFDALGLECQALVENGQAAYEEIQREQPDIVITDIRMPKINGLDLIEMVRKRYPHIRFIVLSGYKEFEYAHRALQYEVDGYLLKPINEAELNDRLGRIVSMLGDREKEACEREKMQREVDESRQIIRRDFLRNIIEQEESGELEELAEEGALPVSLTGNCFRGIDIKLDCQEPEAVSRKEEKLITEHIVDIVERSLKEDAQEVLCCEKEGLHIYCLFNYASDRSREIRSAVSDILSGIKEYLLRLEQFEVTIGIGLEKGQFSEVRRSIREASRAVGNRIHMGCGRLIYAEVLKDMQPYTRLQKETFEELAGLMEDHRAEETAAYVRRLFNEYAARENVDYSGCYELAYELTEFLLARMEGEAGELEKNRKQLWLRCQNCNTPDGLKACLTDAYTRYLELMREAAQSESVKPVRVAKNYIAEHYAEKIVLEDLAELVALNPVYFSVLFKKETDMNFSSYLTQVRMDKAKELLRTTNETIAAIGERVGYRDSRHFSQTFTKTVGVKPILYRRLHA